MTVTVNGERHEIEEGSSVRDLIGVLGLGSGWVVVELNRVVVERAAQSETVLQDGDVVEIVRAVAGG